MPSADRVPVKSPHSTMRWHMWVVPITGSTGSALRAVRPPNLPITPNGRRDLVTPQGRRVPCSARPWPSWPKPIALIMACSELRSILQWPPPIADVLKAIREQEMRWRYRLHCVSAIVNDYAETLSKLVERKAWLARPEEERAAEREYRRDTLSRLTQRLRASSAVRTWR
jgi:hypothetical protein